MFKAHCLSTLVAVSLTAVLGAWGQQFPQDSLSESTHTHFPLNPKQAWAMEESLLVWKAYEDDTDYAVHRFLTAPTSNFQKSKQSIKHPEFDWGAGVRVKLTRYLPSIDPWDINLIGTYYHAHADDNAHVNFNVAQTVENTLLSTWDTSGTGSAVKGRASTQMNFFTFDLTAGRYYSLTRKIDIHPFIGVRAVLNYQVYKTSFLGTVLSPPAEPTSRSQFKGDSDFWGVGPRIGTDVALRLGSHWSLMGTFGVSLFGGRYDISERFKGSVIANTASPYHEKLVDKDTVLRSNIDASVGLGWEKWVRRKTVRIAPSFVFEVSEWFSMKRWVDSHFSKSSFSDLTNPKVYPYRRYSDLGLMGFNMNLKVDF
jgi:hypothetical protein